MAGGARAKTRSSGGLEPEPVSRVRSSRLSSIEAAGREAMALTRQATLLHRDVGWSRPMWAQPGDDIVVLVHGLFATAGVLRPLRERIQAETRAHTASFTHAPGPGIESLAAQLRALVLGLPADTRIYLIGHSIGGLVVRWYVQELGGDPRIAYTISLASPFAGTRHARFLPSPIGRDIVPGSSLLGRLGAGARGGLGVPHLSIAADHDHVVPSGAFLASGDRCLIRGTGHNSLLYRDDVAERIVARIRLVQAAAQVCAARLGSG